MKRPSDRFLMKGTWKTCASSSVQRCKLGSPTIGHKIDLIKKSLSLSFTPSPSNALSFSARIRMFPALKLSTCRCLNSSSSGIGVILPGQKLVADKLNEFVVRSIGLLKRNRS